MQFLYDYITAALVGTVVLLILAAIQFSGKSAGTDAGFYYMNRVQTLALIHMIERDFPNIGAGVSPQSGEMIVDHVWSEDERWFTFRAVVDTTAGAPIETIQYRLESVENPTCEAAEVQCYEVQRLVDRGSGFRQEGSSNSFITDFEIELFPQTANLSDVREVRVRLAALSPGGEKSTVSRTGWETRFRPFNLTFLNS